MATLIEECRGVLVRLAQTYVCVDHGTGRCSDRDALIACLDRLDAHLASLEAAEGAACGSQGVEARCREIIEWAGDGENATPDEQEKAWLARQYLARSALAQQAAEDAARRAAEKAYVLGHSLGLLNQVTVPQERFDADMEIAVAHALKGGEDADT